MRIFECLMSDDRYTVPQLSWLCAPDLAWACVLARRELSSDPHIRSLELREGERLVLVLERWDPVGGAPAAPGRPVRLAALRGRKATRRPVK